MATNWYGGTELYVTVANKDGQYVFQYWMTDEDNKLKVEQLQEKYHMAMLYFSTQGLDCVTTMEQVLKYTMLGDKVEGMVTIGVAVEILWVVEYLTPTLMEQLKWMKKEWEWFSTPTLIFVEEQKILMNSDGWEMTALRRLL